MPYTLTAAGADELDLALSIVRDAAKDPDSHWDEEYPTKDILKGDIERGDLYILREGEKPLSVIVLLPYDTTEQPDFPWPEPVPESVMLARLGIIREAQGTGLASVTVRMALAVCRERRYKTATLMTDPDNARTNHIYQKLGFQYKGNAVLWETDRFAGYTMAL